MKDDKLLILDCFGLFAGDPFMTIFKRHIKENAIEEKDKICMPGDRGEYGYDEVVKRAAALMNITPADIEAERKEIAKPRLDMIAFAKDMRNKHTVVLLSDSFEGLLDKTFEGTDFHECFDKEFVSCAYGVTKPFEQAYLNVLNEMGRNYSSIVFLDDNPRNIAPCEKLGIKGVLFIDLEDAKRKLKELGY